MNVSRFSIGLNLACVAFLSLASICSASHPFHTSSAELDWNESSKRWEVALRIHAGDLELALTRQFDMKVDIESQQAEKLIVDYLAGRLQFLPRSTAEKLLQNHQFFFSQSNLNLTSMLRPTSEVGSLATETKAASKSDQRAGKSNQDPDTKIQWVGSELEGTWMWLYFEILPMEGSEEIVLLSQLLTEVNEDQINILSVRYQGKRVTRQTGRSQLWISFQ